MQPESVSLLKHSQLKPADVPFIFWKTVLLQDRKLVFCSERRLRDVSIGVLSFGAHSTLENTLRRHRDSGLDCIGGEFFVFFNAMTEADSALASLLGVTSDGAFENLGIYGGFRAIAQRATNPYVLILENDLTPVASADIGRPLASCLQDMIENDIKIFSLRSRVHPGQGEPYRKYISAFGVRAPVATHLTPSRTTLAGKLKMIAKYGYLDKFKGLSVFAEQHPDLVQPRAVKKLPSGNYVTDSRFLNWSNQALLVERAFFLDVVCRRVDERPDRRLLNGKQDIERAMNSWWWRRRREPMGHAAEGIFTHARLDR